MTQSLFADVDHYIAERFVKEDDALLSTTRSIEEAGLPNGSISPNQGQFLQILARTVNARKILELGSYAGYSTIWLAKSLPPEGRLITLEFDPRHAAMARENIQRAGLDGIVELREGKALDHLPTLVQESAGPFDLIFIDADKPPYAEYFQWALALSRPGTLIVFDNVVREGKVLDPQTKDEAVAGVQRLNDLLGSDPRVSATIIPTVGVKSYDGMAIALVHTPDFSATLPERTAP